MQATAQIREALRERGLTLEFRDLTEGNITSLGIAIIAEATGWTVDELLGAPDSGLARLARQFRHGALTLNGPSTTIPLGQAHMANQTNTSSKSHYRTLPDGRKGCLRCDAPATRWIDMERYGFRRWLSTAYCDDHGDHEMKDPHHTHRVRPMR